MTPMKRTAFFILTFLAFNIVTAMAQYLDLSNQPVLLGKSNGSTYYLIFVKKNEFHYFFTKTGKSDININYGLRIESDNQRYFSMSGYGAQFIPDSVGRYKIMEVSGGNTFYYRETVENTWKEGHSHPSGIAHFVGFSDDQSLWAVQALNYLNEHTVEPVIYDSAQIDRQPAFMNGDTVVNFEKYITNALWEVGTLKKTELATIDLIEKIDSINSLSGFVRFTFVVRENGEISHIALDEINLSNPNAILDVCVGMNYHICTLPTVSPYSNVKKYTWIPGEINGIPVAVRQFVTVHFKNENQ